MKKVPPNRVRSHADFDLTPLGMWADRGDAALMPGARHFQYPASQTLFASDGLGEVLIRNQNFKAPKSSSDIDSLVWPFGAIEGGGLLWRKPQRTARFAPIAIVSYGSLIHAVEPGKPPPVSEIY